MSERIPLQASATSRAMAGRMITLPSRSTGTPSQDRPSADSREARSCNGKVIWLKTIVGIGIINQERLWERAVREHNSILETTRSSHTPARVARIVPERVPRRFVQRRGRLTQAPRFRHLSTKASAESGPPLPNYEGRKGRHEETMREVGVVPPLLGQVGQSGSVEPKSERNKDYKLSGR
jgi:hypothetical protein